MNSKLFKKSIDLKKHHIFGGRNDITYKTCTTTTELDNGCTLETTSTYDDNNTLLKECFVTTCPE